MDSRLRLCIVGCGAAAKTHARVLKGHADRIELLFASRSAGRAAEYASRFGGVGSFSSYAEAFASEQVDGVVICTPHNLHFPQTCEALSRGKHVVVEKPMALCFREAAEMNRLAQKSDRRLLVAENFAFRPSVCAVSSLLRAGDLGVLKYIQIGVMSGRGLRAETWRSNADSMGGGPLIDGGVHWAHLLLTYGGGQAVRVFAEAPPHTQQSFAREDSMVILCRLPNGMVGTLVFSKGIVGSFKQKFYSIHGSEGSVYVSNRGGFAIMRGKRRLFKRFPRQDRRGFGAMWSNFLDAIEKGTPSEGSGIEAARDIAFVEAAYESADRGEAVVPSGE